MHSIVRNKLFLPPSGKTPARRPSLPSCPVFSEKRVFCLTSYFPFDTAGLKKGETVLVMGSGLGGDAFAAALHVGEAGLICGLERSRAVLDLAEGTRRGLCMENVRFVRGSAERMPLPDTFADAAVSNMLFRGNKDRSKTLSEAFRVLKPGGRIVLADIAAIRKPKRVYMAKNDPVANFFKRSAGLCRYARELKKAGFAHILIRPWRCEPLVAIRGEYAVLYGRRLRFCLWPIVLSATKPPAYTP